MSFRFGEFDTAAVPGVTATLKAWPSTAHKVETVDLLDGAFWARTGIGPIRFVFDVRLQATTPAAVLALRDTLAGILAPSSGVRALVPETADGWLWWAVVESLSDWERGLWLSGVECQLRAEVTFLVPDGVGWADPDDTATGSGTVTLTRAKGNLPSYPSIEVAGVFGAVAVTVGGWAIDVAVPVAAGQTLALDWQGMDFAVWAGGVKVAHAAPGMSRFDRPVLAPGSATTVQATPTTGAVSALTVKANSRKG